MRGALSLSSFRRLALAYTLNEAADWFATIALTVLVYDRTGEALATTALFLSTRFLPSLVVPALASFAERRSVRLVLGLGYTGEAALFVVLALTADDLGLAVLCLIAMLDGTLAATARAVTRGATVRVLEPAGLLREGNSIMNIGFSVMNVAAPATAGLAVAQLGASEVLWIVAGVFTGLAVLMVFARETPEGVDIASSWHGRLREGFAYIRQNRLARGLLAVQAVLLVLFNIAVPIEVIYAKDVLDAGDLGFGLLIASWGAGMVGGSVVFARVSRRSLVALVVVSTAIVCIGYLGLAAVTTLPLACAAAVIGGLGNGMQWVAVITAIQESIDDEMQARAAGMLEAVLTASPGLGFLVGGVLATVWDARTAFAVAGIAGLLTISAAWVAWRGTGDLPPPRIAA